jgi:lipopolysaccharide/colanic/teichoic acid biosynthesis glycosyltransferase
MSIRLCDFILSLIGIIVLLPIFVLVSIAVILESRGGALYRQIRVGKHGKDFVLFKFRTMYLNSDNDGLLTVGKKDSRITRVGFILRKYKLDELPQLINVFIGDMSIVGPRPEVRKYVDLYSEKQKRILLSKPGITDIASIEYYDENELLKNSIDHEKLYIEKIMPAKIELNMLYINNQSIMNYFEIILKTISRIFNRN